MKFDIVVFTKPKEHGIATKRIKRVNGEIVSDASECRDRFVVMSHGQKV